MKNQSGKTPFQWIIIIAVGLIIGGVVIAMIFGDTSEVPNILNQMK